MTGEVKKRVHSIYPNVSGVLTTAGGLVFTGYTDGTFVAYDDTTLEPAVEDQCRHRLQCPADDASRPAASNTSRSCRGSAGNPRAGWS